MPYLVIYAAIATIIFIVSVIHYQSYSHCAATKPKLRWYNVFYSFVAAALWPIFSVLAILLVIILALGVPGDKHNA